MHDFDTAQWYMEYVFNHTQDICYIKAWKMSWTESSYDIVTIYSDFTLLSINFYMSGMGLTYNHCLWFGDTLES